MTQPGWKFRIDVGGTFTDCVARAPDGAIRVAKVLSSGVVRAVVEEGGALRPVDFPAELLVGYRTDEGHAVRGVREGALRLARPLGRPSGEAVALTGGEPAPVLAVRRVMGLGLTAPPGPLELRLGTTRATNALLERRGAATALVTTAGFGDVLAIGNQDRPELFALHVHKAPPLYRRVLELSGRMDAAGNVIEEQNPLEIENGLRLLKASGIRSLAVCLLHAYRADRHERRVRDIATAVGFSHVSLSSEVSSTINLVSRAETTVVDAYLTPVIRSYVREIEESLPEAEIRLMTSAGSLVPPASFRGKDAVLSGPAGGVVAVAAIAEEAGIARAIGFDMGGTSTDVCRIEGEAALEYEAVKAGVRIVTPMLSIETVAAGGGSICDTDGQKLTVGPTSAGAEPGPACYGRGGPLTVTDLNVFLGRVRSADFPFPLDVRATERALDELRGRLPDPAERVDLARGLLRIANNGMAAAIERVSKAKGYDVRDHTLVAFGGAAAQHACAVARELGVRAVRIHPRTGVLSAWGMGKASVRRFSVRTRLERYERGLHDAELAEMGRVLGHQIEAEGIDPAHLDPPRVRLEMRYRGQSSAIVIEASDGDYARAFEAAHHRLYGHVFAGRELEVVALRAERAARQEPDRAPLVEASSGRPSPAGESRVIFDVPTIVPVYRREALRPGHVFDGPALVVERTATTVLEPGWTCRVTERSELLLEDEIGREAETVSLAADPVMLEVFHNRFASIAEQMGVTLRRTSLSVNVKERLDYSCAVFSAVGDLVANAPHMPVHLGAMSRCVKCVLEDVPELLPGDVVVTNDPFRGGSHLPDVTVVTPVFGEGGRRTFFVASRAHHAEIGGIRPGSMPPDSRNLAEEGVLLRAFKVVAAGAPCTDELRRLLTAGSLPSRSPDENVADVEAQIAANRVGALALGELAERYGTDTVAAYMEHIREASAAKVREKIGEIEDGTHEFRDAMDDGSEICCRIEIDGGETTVDFEGTAAVHAGNLNANPAIVHAAVIYVFRCLIDEPIPLSSGVLTPIRIVVPPNSMLDPAPAEDPRRSPAVVGGNVETSQRITDVLLGALGLAAASQGTMNNVTFGDGTFGYYETICGGTGAGAGFPGADAVHSHMTNTRLTDPEVLESRYPVRLRSFAIRRGSGGRGRFRGGDGVRREIEFLAPLELSILSQRRATVPWGIRGGGAGFAGRNRLLRADGTIVELGPIRTVHVAPHDVLVIETPGGGGAGFEADGGTRDRAR